MSRDLLRFKIVPNCYSNHHAKFEIDLTILKCLKTFHEPTLYVE